MQNRIIFKVLATGLNFLMSIVIGILVPRAIGPSSYGDFSYIISTYSFLLQFWMFTSTTAYIYFLSHGKYKIEDVNIFYMLFLGLISFLIVMIGLVTVNSEFGIKYLWNGLDNQYLLYLGLVFGLLTNLQQRLIEFSDSTSQTIVSEKLKLASRFIMVSTIVVFILYEWLNIYWYFILSIANILLFLTLFFRYISFNVAKIQFSLLKEIFDDFYIYLKPLIIFTLIAAIYSYLGKYILQSSGGSIEQGYYNFAYQLAMIPVTFISSIMAIYMSEMTKKFQTNDIVGVKEIFVKNIFKVYTIHALIVFFMLVNAKEIILLTVGEQFLGATGALQALSIFSLLHTLGMLSGNIIQANGETKLYGKIAIIVNIIGISVMLFMNYFLGFTASLLGIVMWIIYALQVVVFLVIVIKKIEYSLLLFFSKCVFYTFLIFIFIQGISNASKSF